ncbi:BppU family phage baseplate upper protein [Sutcliffiella cohnii]|uniref:BppU family phage baseplate upper protein n=1 Tax=Sutcliffiella cohnii TaxID=33932 RepID=UPI002E202D0E|nr:BppU family phage baseplate upper protein [Sutcliffiella cohnii]
MLHTKRSDTYDSIHYRLRSKSGQSFDLTGATVRFYMESRSGKLLVNDEAEIVNATQGDVKYSFKEGDTNLDGIHRAEFQVTFSDGSVKTFPEDKYLSVTISKNIDSDRSTLIEEQVVARVSLIEEFKNDINEKVEVITEKVANVDEAVINANEQANYAKEQGDYAKQRTEELEGVDAVQFKNRQDGFESQLAQTEQQATDTLRYIHNNLTLNLAYPKVDPYGLKSVNIIGDSISHGANAFSIFNDAYASVIRKAMQIIFNTSNHGFISVMPQISNAVGQYMDMLYITATGWTGANATDVPGFYKRTSSTVDHIINAWLQDKTFKINKLGVGVVKSVNGGNIDVLVKNSQGAVVATQTFSLNSATETQEILWLDTTLVTDFHKLEVINKSGTNTVFGFYLIEDENKVVLNNHSRSGAKIEDLSDSLIDKLFNTNVVIFALGHNSTPSAIDPYLEKCRLAYETYKPMVYVVDLTWTTGRAVTGQKLKKFASDCKGQYIEIIPRVSHPNTLIDSGFLSDTSHPTPFGMKIIAEKVLTSMMSPITSKDLVQAYKMSQNNSPQKQTITLNTGYTLETGTWSKIGSLNTFSIEVTGSPFTSGSTIAMFPKPPKAINAVGHLFHSGGTSPCNFTLNGLGNLVIYPPAGLTSVTRFICTLHYENA